MGLGVCVCVWGGWGGQQLDGGGEFMRVFVVCVELWGIGSCDVCVRSVWWGGSGSVVVTVVV